MSANKKQEKIDEIFKRIKNADCKVQAALFEEINKKFLNFLAEENYDSYGTNGASDFLSWISESVEKEFDELLNIDSDKKRFIKALSKIFVLWLNTNIVTVEKIRRIIKIAIETTLKI